MNDVRLAAMSDEPLDLDAHLAAVEDRRLGAVTTFIGRVSSAWTTARIRMPMRRCAGSPKRRSPAAARPPWWRSVTAPADWTSAMRLW